MKLDLISNKKETKDGVNLNDEYYTPVYAIEPLLKYLKPQSNIWCPFDSEKSNFVKELFVYGHNPSYSHIDDNQDFFTTDTPPDTHYIISNPPYSRKNEVLERLFELKIPFAMLLGVVGIFESKLRFNLFKKNKFEIMYFDKRIKYFQDYSDPKESKVNPPFSSVYICSGILPNQIVFEELNPNL
jgi:hypothetical protein